MDPAIPPPSTRRFPTPGILLAAAAVTLACVASQWNIDGNRRIDYRIYVRAVSSIDHSGLYAYGNGILRFTYPPVAAVVVWPFTWIDEAVGSRIWLVLSVAAFVAAYALAIRHGGGRRPIPVELALLGGAAAVWLAPALSTLRLGQINAFVALLLCADAVALHRGSRTAGIGTGLAAAIKVTPLAVVPLLWFAGRGPTRAAAVRAAATGAAITGIGALVAPGATWQFLQRLGGRAVDRAPVASVDLRVLLRSAIGAPTVADVIWLLATVALVAASLRTARRLGRRAGTPDGVGLVTVGMCLSTVVSPFSSVHHLTFASIAVALWAMRATSTWHRVVAVGGLLALLDPTAGEAALGRWAMVVFCIVTVVALPNAAADVDAVEVDPTPAADFAEDDPIPQDVGLLRGGH